jgi:hypothetical protein
MQSLPALDLSKSEKSGNNEYSTENGKLSSFGKPPESRQHFDVWNFTNNECMELC